MVQNKYKYFLAGGGDTRPEQSFAHCDGIDAMADRASECVAADATNTEKNRKGLPPELRHILPKNTLVFRVQRNQCEPQVAQGELLNAIWQRMAQLLDPPKTSTTPSETHWQQGRTS